MFTTRRLKLRYAIILQLIAGLLYADMVFSDLSNTATDSGTQLALINFLIQVAIMVALSMILAPKPKQPKKPLPVGLEQFDIPTAEEGRPIQVLFGKRYIASSNVVWYGHYRTVAVWG
jgi:hypothetical protein